MSKTPPDVSGVMFCARRAATWAKLGRSPYLSGVPDELPDPQEDNISRLAALHAKTEESVSHHQRRIERLTARLAQPAAIYAIVSAVALWLVWNALAPQRLAFDRPPFGTLQLLLSFLSLLVSTMVLTSQSRQGHQARQRSHLDLHINLLAEQKIAKVISMLEELRTDLPSVPNRPDPEAESMKAAANPEKLIQAIDEQIDRPMNP